MGPLIRLVSWQLQQQQQQHARLLQPPKQHLGYQNIRLPTKSVHHQASICATDVLATYHHLQQRLTLLLLLLQVGFPRRDPDRLRVALDNTHRLIWIRSLKQSRVARLGQLLGFARATSDGVFSATIW
jgi:hypothetical protein